MGRVFCVCDEILQKHKIWLVQRISGLFLVKIGQKWLKSGVKNTHEAPCIDVQSIRKWVPMLVGRARASATTAMATSIMFTISW